MDVNFWNMSKHFKFCSLLIQLSWCYLTRDKRFHKPYRRVKGRNLVVVHEAA